LKLKADFHIHTGEDPLDNHISYSAKELIDKASKQGFDVLAITNHSRMTFDDTLRDYASEQGILLISGIESRIEGKDVILLNFTSSEVEKISTFEDLKRIKNETNLVIAPHPFFPTSVALNSLFHENIEIFDAVEITSVYFRFIDFNWKARKVAKRFDLPLVGSSDTHSLSQLGSTYSLINAEKKVDSVIKAIKDKKIEVITRPMALNMRNIKMAFSFAFNIFNKKYER
jgi:hypothetical protein